MDDLQELVFSNVTTKSRRHSRSARCTDLRPVFRSDPSIGHRTGVAAAESGRLRCRAEHTAAAESPFFSAIRSA
jgi:hypothetical protein